LGGRGNPRGDGSKSTASPGYVQPGRPSGRIFSGHGKEPDMKPNIEPEPLPRTEDRPEPKYEDKPKQRTGDKPEPKTGDKPEPQIEDPTGPKPEASGSSGGK